MNYRLYRRYGKRSWTVGMYASLADANKAAVENVEKNGHLYPKGTTFGVEYHEFLGFVNEGKLSPQSGIDWAKAQ